MLIAIGHILGSIIATLVFGVIVLAISGWILEKVEKQRREEMAMKLGIAIQDLENEELGSKILELASERYGSDLLSNRLSDLCGYIRTMWDWLGSLIQIGTFFGVCWFTFTDNISNAAYAWFIPLTAVVFWLCSVLFTFVCRLVTGRYPGEAKQARKSATEFLSSQSKLSNAALDQELQE